MTKITYIPGEIANAAIDEHGNRKPVTRTHHIFDDNLEKPQSEVNQDRIEDVANLDSKIATEKQRAEGVESGLNNRLGTVEQLAEISIGGGDAQIATGADFTNPDATKRAKIPTVGAIVDGLNDGIYDVSKRNPTAGPNSDGKFTLEYILSNADTLIPTGWRHGGMTISFVHTYDNKYVQARCMAQSFTTDVTQWQGVDEKINIGSRNLAESGAVADLVSFYEFEKDVAVSSSMQLVGTFKTKYIYGEFDIIFDVNETTATFSGDGMFVIYEGSDNKGSFNSPVSATSMHVVKDNITDDGVLSLYVRPNRVTSAGKLKLKIVADNTNWARIAELTAKDSSQDVNIEKNADGVALDGLQQKRMLIPTRKVKKPINLPLIYGQMYYSGLIQKRTDGMRYEEIIISPTAKYYYTGTSRTNGVEMVRYYDKDNTLLGTAIVGTGTNVSHTEEELTLPEGTFKMRVGSFIASGYNELLITVEDYASRFVEQYGTNDLWAKKYTDVPLTLEAGKNIQVDGTISTFSSGCCSQLITINKTKKYKLNTRVDQYCCGAVFYSDNEGTACVGFQITSYSSKDISEVLDIPTDAITMRVGTRNRDIINLYEIEYEEAATLDGVKELQEEIQQLGTDFVPLQQGSSNYGKVLTVGADGNVTLGDGGGEDPTANAVVEHQGKALYLGADIINNPQVTLGQGWSGSLANGFTHTSGNTADLVIQQATIAGKSYLVECTLSVAAEASIYLSIGNSPKVDVYNGSTNIKVGIISPDGGYLKITPASSFEGAVSAIHIKEIVNEESAIETLNINVNNIENGTMRDNLTGFWNVVLGTINTMQHNQNGSRNIVAGYSAMAQFKSGTRNVMLGTFAGCNLECGDRNIAIGADAFWYAQTGKDNIAIGYAAMGRMNYSNPSSNIAIGSQALGYLQSDASNNVAIGKLSCNYSGRRNVGVGEYANYYSKGNDNVAIGYYAQGYAYETGEKNISIGAFAKCGNSGTAQEPETINNAIAIGYNAVATKSNQVVIGNADHTEFVLGNKKLVFNNDNTVTWETIS